MILALPGWVFITGKEIRSVDTFDEIVKAYQELYKAQSSAQTAPTVHAIYLLPNSNVLLVVELEGDWEWGIYPRMRGTIFVDAFPPTWELSGNQEQNLYQIEKVADYIGARKFLRSA
jgi:hypothetical protein